MCHWHPPSVFCGVIRVPRGRVVSSPSWRLPCPSSLRTWSRKPLPCAHSCLGFLPSIALRRSWFNDTAYITQRMLLMNALLPYFSLKHVSIVRVDKFEGRRLYVVVETCLYFVRLLRGASKTARVTLRLTETPPAKGGQAGGVSTIFNDLLTHYHNNCIVIV